MNLTREGVYHVFKEEFLLFICIFKRLIIFPNELIYYIFSLYENIILPKIFIDIDQTISYIFNNNRYVFDFRNKPWRIHKEETGFKQQINYFPTEKIISLCYYCHTKYIITNKQIYKSDVFIDFGFSSPITTSLTGWNISTRSGKDYMLIHTTEGLFVLGSHNKYGQLGLGDIKEYSLNRGLDLYDFKKIQINNVLMYDCGDKHTFILTQNGDLFCCGSNKRGQLGTFTPTIRMIPSQHNMTNIISFSCGSHHTFILTIDGLFSSGCNENGQLGRNVESYLSKSSHYFSPIDIENTLSFSCGEKTSLIMTKSGLFLTEERYFDGTYGSKLIKINLFVTKIILFKCGFSKKSIVITKDGVYILMHNEIDLPSIKKFPIFDNDLWSQKARIFY
jgi:alpha-tubulin suppressor-like RCC1 family protein